MRRLLGAVVLATLALTGPAGHAIGFLGLIDRVGLTKEDYRLLGEAAAVLYETGTPEVGAHNLWNNPKSGSVGAIEVLSFDGRCVLLEHIVRTGKTQRVHRAEVQRCRGDDGVWRLSGEE